MSCAQSRKTCMPHVWPLTVELSVFCRNKNWSTKAVNSQDDIQTCICLQGCWTLQQQPKEG